MQFPSPSEGVLVLRCCQLASQWRMHHATRALKPETERNSAPEAMLLRQSTKDPDPTQPRKRTVPSWHRPPTYPFDIFSCHLKSQLLLPWAVSFLFPERA
jgi:hypothetical protein